MIARVWCGLWKVGTVAIDPLHTRSNDFYIAPQLTTIQKFCHHVWMKVINKHVQVHTSSNKERQKFSISQREGEVSLGLSRVLYWPREGH